MNIVYGRFPWFLRPLQLHVVCCRWCFGCCILHAADAACMLYHTACWIVRELVLLSSPEQIRHFVSRQEIKFLMSGFGGGTRCKWPVFSTIFFPQYFRRWLALAVSPFVRDIFLHNDKLLIQNTSSWKTNEMPNYNPNVFKFRFAQRSAQVSPSHMNPDSISSNRGKVFFSARMEKLCCR